MLLLNLLLSAHGFAASGDSEAVVLPNSSLRYTQHQASCEKVAAYDMVCDTVGLDSDQAKKAQNLVQLLPETTFVDDCDRKRAQLKKCLEQSK